MRINLQIEIEAPAEEVFAYIADLSNNPEWQSGVETTRWTSELPAQVGSTCEQTLDGGGAVGYSIVAIEPGMSITVKTEYGAVVPATVTRIVQDIEAGRSRVRMELVGTVPGWRRATTPLLRRLVGRSIMSDYRRLKRILERKDEDEHAS